MFIENKGPDKVTVAIYRLDGIYELIKSFPLEMGEEKEFDLDRKTDILRVFLPEKKVPVQFDPNYKKVQDIWDLWGGCGGWTERLFILTQPYLGVFDVRMVGALEIAAIWRHIQTTGKMPTAPGPGFGSTSLHMYPSVIASHSTQ